mmetsp:Transcript_33080/g.53006  ORF Transcript_33080/g.53006 Transcript_33080/m.53006 type:complete len:213 (+) Transcript_33080:665-1303(+)
MSCRMILVHALVPWLNTRTRSSSPRQPQAYNIEVGGGGCPSPGRNLVCVPLATSLPPFTVRMVTSRNASDLPTRSTSASTSTSCPLGPGDMKDTPRSTLTPGAALTVTNAAVETTSTSVATHPPCRVPYLFCTCGSTGKRHTHRPGSNRKSCKPASACRSKDSEASRPRKNASAPSVVPPARPLKGTDADADICHTYLATIKNEPLWSQTSD